MKRASTSAALRILSGEDFGTHADALAHALHEVGLTPTNPEE